MLMKLGPDLPKRFDLSALRLAASVGEPRMTSTATSVSRALYRHANMVDGILSRGNQP